jgi:hypothetical protein
MCFVFEISLQNLKWDLTEVFPMGSIYHIQNPTLHFGFIKDFVF